MLYSQIYGIPVSVLHLTNVHGPRMRIKDAGQTFIGWWIRQILEGQPLCVYGDGLQLRDINFVEDVVDAMLMASATPAAVGQVFNLEGEPISLSDLARFM